MSIDHYENFPVASVLCPPALRAPVTAIYHFARTADDLADEGVATPAARLEDLRAYRADLDAVASGRAPSARWAHVFQPLQQQLHAHALPVPLLHQLLDAFEQDLTQHRYRDRDDLLAYCSRSASPVGRLLLHLYGIQDELSLRQSDCICTGLQLANFWQDLSVDTARGRLYIPLSDCARFGVEPEALLRRERGPQADALVADLIQWTRDLLQRGAPLVHTVPGRAGWELRGVVQGGLRILDRAASVRTPLTQRPTLNAWDVAVMGLRALFMTRPAQGSPLPKGHA